MLKYCILRICEPTKHMSHNPQCFIYSFHHFVVVNIKLCPIFQHFMSFWATAATETVILFLPSTRINNSELSFYLNRTNVEHIRIMLIDAFGTVYLLKLCFYIIFWSIPNGKNSTVADLIESFFLLIMLHLLESNKLNWFTFKPHFKLKTFFHHFFLYFWCHLNRCKKYEKTICDHFSNNFQNFPIEFN